MITGQNVVADSISTFDTHYSSSLGDTIALLADEDGGYVSMPSSFFNVSKKDDGRNYFSLTHDATGTSRIVRGKRLSNDLMEAGGYSDPVKAFRALAPMQGDVQFIVFQSYGYSELEADAVGFTELICLARRAFEWLQVDAE